MHDLSALFKAPKMKVVKTFETKKEWGKFLQEWKVKKKLAIMAKEKSEKLNGELGNVKSKFWIMVEEDLDLAGKSLHFNEKKNVIELMERDE